MRTHGVTFIATDLGIRLAVAPCTWLELIGVTCSSLPSDPQSWWGTSRTQGFSTSALDHMHGSVGESLCFFGFGAFKSNMVGAQSAVQSLGRGLSADACATKHRNRTQWSFWKFLKSADFRGTFLKPFQNILLAWDYIQDNDFSVLSCWTSVLNDSGGWGTQIEEKYAATTLGVGCRNMPSTAWLRKYIIVRSQELKDVSEGVGNGGFTAKRQQIPAGFGLTSLHEGSRL